MDYAYLHLEMHKTLLTSILLVLLCQFASAQNTINQDSITRDSLEQEESFKKPKTNPRIAYIEDFKLGIDTFYKDDTLFYNFHRFNPVYENYKGVQDLGYMASAYESQLFERDKDIGFDLGIHVYDHLLRTSKETKFYEAQMPFTHFYYNQGKEGLLNLKAFHTQNILPNWNIAADYRSFKSDGIYLRQSQKIKNTQVSSKYTTLNGRYALAASLNWNRLTYFENGGITSDSLFESASNLNKNVPIHLQAAQNNIKTREHGLYHHIKFGGKKLKYRENDTVEYIDHKLLLFHQLDWNRYIYKHTDENLADSFYHNIYFFNPSITEDSTTYNVFKNKVGLTLPIHLASFKGGLTGFGSYEQISIDQGDSLFDKNYNAGLGGELILTRKGKIFNSIKGTLDYLFQGMNANDMKIKGRTNVYKDSMYRLGFHAQWSALEPSYVQQTMYSNHYFWFNNFEKEKHLKYGVSLSRKSKKMVAKITLEQNILTDFVYYDSLSEAKQLNNGNLSISSIGLSLNFALGNFRFNNEVFLQSSNSEAVIHIPNLISSHQIYFQRYAFEDVLKFQIGLELFYNSSYSSDKYNPAIRQFYLQDEVQTGNYPLMNAFLNFQIKTMKIFFQLEHFNQGFTGKRYYGTAHQPITPRRFVLGVGWNLYY